MRNDLMKRYRISVPLDDASVIEWMTSQHSLSLSIRQLVKAAIEVNGMRDYFASDAGEVVQKPRRGRPPKVAQEVVEELIEETEQDTIQSRIARMQGIMNK